MFDVTENSGWISFLLRPRYAIEVVLQPVTVIESPAGLANHRASIAIRRYPERFVCAIASGAHERSHLLPLQHTRKKACDNYYGEYVSPLSLSSLSFHPVTTRIPRPSLFIYTPFSSTSIFPVAVIPSSRYYFFRSPCFAALCMEPESEQILRKICHKRNKISIREKRENNIVTRVAKNCF